MQSSRRSHITAPLLLALVAASPLLAGGLGGPGTAGQTCTLTDTGSAAVGTYASTTGDRYLVTPGARRALNLIDVTGYRLGRMAPATPTSAEWQAIDGTVLGSIATVEIDAGRCRLELRIDEREIELLPVTSSPFRQEAVSIRAESAELAGTAFLPIGTDPAPGVVVIHGSDDSDRDNIWYVMVSEYLARSGIAVLLPDKRGSGGSGGDWRSVGFETLGRDAEAAIARLAGFPEVQAGAVGVLSMSQGGWVAPLAAAGDGAAFAVVVSGAVVPLWRQQIHYLTALGRRMGLPDTAVTELLDLYRAGLRIARTGEGWPEYAAARADLLEGPAAGLASAMPAEPDHWSLDWGRRVVDFDPLPAWQEADVPLLAIFGRDDINVPVEDSIERLRQGLGCDDERCRIVAYEDTGHGILEPGGDRPRADFLELVAAWIHAQRR